MRFHPALGAVVFIALAADGLGGERVRKPRLDVRVSPRVALLPVNVLLMAELVGGDELEEFYCPGLEWDWGDGARSAHEADCPPFEAGTTLERIFSARHAYRQPGEYDLRVRLLRADRTVAVATAHISIRGGFASFDSP